MLFRRICIIGLGLIGGSLASAFKRKKIGDELIAIDKPEVIQKALEQKHRSCYYVLNGGSELHAFGRAFPRE